jgi:hypothetical protein
MADSYAFSAAEIDDYWTSRLGQYGEPETCSGIEIVEFAALRDMVVANKVTEIKKLINQLVEGKLVLARGAFSRAEVEAIKSAALQMRQSQPSSFHKMLEGVPNSWRDITEELSAKYAVPVVKKSAYFYPMNGDESGLFRLIYPRWRILKALGGRMPTEFEDCTPKSGKVDRIQIVEYPAGSGHLNAHHDPSHNQRLIMSGYLSKRGVDFQGGGFWVRDKDGGKLDAETVIEVGDIGFCYANVIHGVDASEAPAADAAFSGKPPASRWFLSMYTNDSDEIADRITLRSV